MVSAATSTPELLLRWMSVLNAEGSATAGLYLADIWIRPKWADGWAILETNCPLGERLALTRGAQMIGRRAGALASDAMQRHTDGWEEASLVGLIESEARFRGIPGDDVDELVEQLAWWVGGAAPASLAMDTGDTSTWPDSAGGIWLGAALIARWTASITGLTDADIYEADVGDLVSYALCSVEPDVGLVSPMTREAGIGVVQMAYAPDLVIGWTVIERRSSPAPNA